MEKGTLIGLVLAVVFVSTTIMMAVHFDILVAFGSFIDPPSAILVIGGTFASAMIAVKFETFKTSMRAGRIVFRPPVLDPASAINQIVGLANTARKEGVLALEDSAAAMEDEFLKKGIMLIVDGTDPDLVKGIMETELSYLEERHGGVAATYDSMAGFAPAWGMCGTLIALIVMLNDLDGDTLGPNMAMALITTFYGMLVANVWATPFSNKLKQVSKEEVLLKTVLIEGMLSIQAGENPRIIEEKLKSFLAPATRGNVGPDGAPIGGGAGEDGE